MSVSINRHQNIQAIVVTFCSDIELLVEQFNCLLTQVNKIVWVDNASPHDLRHIQCQWPSDRLNTIWLDQNHGIGAAQNRGIELALADGATHVLLMDDDSLPAPDMVSSLMFSMQSRPDAAAIGACHTDARRNLERTPFSKVEGWQLRWLVCNDSKNQVWEIDHVIASGCLIPASALKKVGPMREDFFIDWVDTEWCFRAKGMGFKIYGDCSASMRHSLGDGVINIMGIEIPQHQPWRHYYQSRNFILMCKSGTVARRIKFNMAFRQFKRFLVFSTLVPGRWQYFLMWVRGVADGIMGNSGKRNVS